MVSLQALTSTSPPNPPLRFSTWDCFASIQSYPHTLVYIIVPLQESSKSASASLVKRPQPHSSLQDQVDWSLPIKWTPRSSGPSVNWSLNSHKKSGSASLARGLSHTGTASPLSHNKCFPRPSYSHQPLFPQRLQTPLFLSKNCKKNHKSLSKSACKQTHVIFAVLAVKLRFLQKTVLLSDLPIHIYEFIIQLKL